MDRYVGIVRKKDELETGARELEELKAEARDDARRRAPASTTRAGTRRSSLRSLLITAEAVTRAALMREESRGAHTRARLPRASATSG